MKVCTVSGVQIHLNNMFLALLGLFFVAGLLVKGLIVFAIVLLHELAHVAAAMRLGINVSDIELLPFGGVCRIGGEIVLDPSREVLVAAAGPAANLLLAGLGIALKGHGLWDDQLNAFFIQCNLLLAAFNLLPALPLDGGRVFRAYLARRIGFKEATYKAARLGQFWGVAIVLLASLVYYCTYRAWIFWLLVGFCSMRQHGKKDYAVSFHQAFNTKKTGTGYSRCASCRTVGVF